MDCFALDKSGAVLLEALRSRRELLLQLIREIDAPDAPLPEGSLRVSNVGSSFQYYWRDSPSGKWNYLRKRNLEKARRLVNAEYRRCVLRAARSELGAIDRWIGDEQSKSLVELLACLSPGRRALVESLAPSDQEVIDTFYDYAYESFDYRSEGKKYLTSQGEYVRSKAEWMIAERLHEYGIPYQYEAPITLGSGAVFRPDFRCLNLRKREVLYWEHLGMMGDLDYAASAIRKIQLYEANGYNPGENLIVTEECSTCPLIPEIIESRIRRFLL